MSLDVAALADFYETPLGRFTRHQVGKALERRWPQIRGMTLLGLGYATPYLPRPRLAGGRVIAFMPGWQGVTPWPPEGCRASCLVDPAMMPLADESVDRLLIVHALETVESPAELLHEAARILAPSGRMLIVCPNRRGLWARMDRTPFGQGQPFSRSQLRQLMRATHLAPESWAETLYTPPLRSRFMLRGAPAWEKLGEGLSLPFAGLHVVEASKNLQRPVPIRERRRASRPWPVIVPVPASHHGRSGIGFRDPSSG